MDVIVRLDGRRPRRWHADLAQRLARLPGIGAVTVDDAPGPDSWPANAELLFGLEALVHALFRGGSQILPPAALAERRGTAGSAGLVIDLCGDVETVGPVWRPVFDGQAGETGLLASLLAGRVPEFGLLEWRPAAPGCASGEDVPPDVRVIAAGRLGTEQPGIVLAAFDDGLARTVTMIAAALRERLAGRPGSRALPAGGSAGSTQGSASNHGLGPAPAVPPVAAAPVLGAGRLGRRAAAMLARTVVRRLYRLCYHAPHWRTGWRRLAGPDLIDLGDHPAGGWSVLPDDGRRFYADPFPLAFAGTTHVFVEDFPHATGKGLISAVRFGPDGPQGVPVPVLEEAHHLSYPFVFVREDAAWMVPDSSAAGTVDLYRAARFPGGWVKEATLLAGVVVSDATLVEHAGRWWLFATVRDAELGAPLGAGSFCDALHIWSAPDFRGPFAPIRGNPVLVDPGAARPAGRIVSRGGALIRPVQDCAEGYGRALALARIDRLDTDGFAQTVIRRIGTGPAWPGSRIHTLNAGGGIECIDGSGRASRIRTLLRR